MAKYDFDQLIPRRGTNSVKWDEEPAADILPMWVADMDFRTAPCVVEALRRRVEHGVYGYATVPESYYGAVTSWFARRHGWAPGADWILPVTGVIPALSAILRALTHPGDRVLVLTPVYNHFFIAIDNSGCSAAECELTYGDNRYTVDFDALERRAADPAVKLMLLCNPHNPAGRVWTRTARSPAPRPARRSTSRECRWPTSSPPTPASGNGSPGRSKSTRRA